MEKTSYRVTVGLLLVAAMAVRIAVAYWWQACLSAEHPFAFDDSETYWTLAQKLHHGQSFAYGESMIFRTPGYPLFLAVVMRVVGSDDPLVMRIAGAALGTLTVWLVMRLTTRLMNHQVALLAGCLVAFEPGCIAMSIFVLSEALFVPLLVATMGCLAMMWQADSERHKAAWGGWAGVASAAAVLTRPSWLLFTPGLTLWLICTQGRSVQRSALVGLLAWIACLMPWWIRNYQVAGRFVPTTLQVGASLYDGWRPDADGASDMRFVPDFVAAQKRADEQVRAEQGRGPRGLFEDRLDRRMQQAAIVWAWQHPQRVIQLMGEKWLRMWSPWPHAQELQNGWLRAGIACSYIPCIVAALCGVVRWGGRWPLALCWLPAAYFSLLHMVFIGSIRYRQPPLVLLLIPAAATFYGMFTRLQRLRPDPPAVP